MESTPDFVLSPAASAEATARFARQFIKPNLTIANVSRLSTASSLFNSSRTITLASIENESDLQISGLEADLIVAFDIPEASPEPRPFVRRLAALHLPVLASCRTTPETALHEGHSVGEFEDLFNDEGFSIAWRYFNNGSCLWLMMPRDGDVATVSTVGYSRPGHLVTTLTSERPALLVAGFFGRGNCGDEALLQVIYEQFSPEFDIIVSLDEHGATQGYWDWYPYNLCRRIHQGNLADPARSCIGMIVGGGGLPIGFVADQVLAARSGGVPIAFAGTDFPISSVHSGQTADMVSFEYLRCFDMVSLRSEQSVNLALKAGYSAEHGADWALRLLTDESGEIKRMAARALIVIREFPLSAISFNYVREIARLLTQLRQAGYVPTLLPFCAEDDRFSKALGFDQIASTERHWWNPRRVKQMIAMSGVVISVGRLHPTVIAASSRTAVLQLCPPLADVVHPQAFYKIAAMAKELDIDYHLTVDSVCESLRLGHFRPSGQAALADSENRLDTMINHLRLLFQDGR